MISVIGHWWNEREPREKFLVAIAIFLSLVLGLWFGAVSPILENKADAQRDLTRVAEERVLIDRALLSLRPAGQGSAGPATDNDAFRSTVTRAAQQRGLAITRLQSGPAGTLQLAFSDVVPAEIYAWLNDTSDMPGGEVVAASMTGRDGNVQAVIELQGTQP